MVNKIKHRIEYFKFELKRDLEKLKYQEKPGFLLRFFRNIFTRFYLVTPSKWISGTLEHQQMIKMGNFKPYSNIEKYVLICLGIEIIVALIYWGGLKTNLPQFWVIYLIFVIIFSYRLFDIFQSWVSQFILKTRWEAININRSLLLMFINYLEIILIGANIRFIWRPPVYFGNAFQDSVMTMIANPQPNGSTIQYVQIMFAILFITAVAQHVVGRLSSK